MFEGAIKGALSELDDPYSFYLSPKDLQRESENLYHATFGGLGIHIYTEKEGGRVRIYSPLPNTPAMKAGLQAGDDIIGVNGVRIKIRPNGQRLEDVVDILRGKVGTDVTITVRRRGISEPFNVTLTRKKIKPKSVEKTILEDGIGYILIRQFTGRSSEEFRNALTELRSDKQNEMKALILDLRNNPGGLLDAAHYVADAFISEGIIVSTKGRTPRFDQKYDAKYPELCPSDIPLIVLVNGFSASGSEIVAGAIKDTGRGVILGTRTFGKGLVQQRFPLKNGGGAVSLTVSRYYTPNGISINERLLFSTDLSFQSELDDGKPISESLQAAFDNHGFPIPQSARISVEQQGSNWAIIDKHNTLKYRIRKEKDKLGIYNEKGITPHVVIAPTKLSTIEEAMRKKMRDGDYARHFVEKWIEAEEARIGTPPKDFSKLVERLPELVTILNEKGITLSEHLVKLEMRLIFNRNVGIYQLIDLENDNQVQEAVKILKAGEVGQILASATNQQTDL
jgi:C-terminal peptidase prc